ncbi:DUF4132 domain-containing protein [Actinoalloteichus hymeniacidonis]|uniref:DUF4132 domain-containing protein n=1 Tax=Actinoalloteichus hymeniacidonis TaxID=340345 RepID=UPI000853C879|nr:DUF4132 domain-containing protein [Actinoalloteichus hymeniacidonis]MBB5910450.1 hypothetical protein [Actinoalloteichus hymeniacidonis]
MTDPLPADEDVLVLPPEWFPHLAPRRGGHLLPVVPIKKAIEKADKLVAAAQETIEQRLLGNTAWARFTAAAREHQAGNPSPLGAAVLAGIVASTLTDAKLQRLEVFADAWAAAHGVVFAAEAVAELADMTVTSAYSGSARSWRGSNKTHLLEGPRLRSRDEQHVDRWPGEPIARRVRALLAEADEALYRRAVHALEPRPHGRFRNVVTAFLLPTEQWQQHEDRGIGAAEVELRLQTTTSFTEVALLLSHTEGVRRAYENNPRGLVFTLVEGLAGSAHPEKLAALLHGMRSQSKGIRAWSALSEALAVVPTDDAFLALVGVGLADPLVSAAHRFPRRALRLLAKPVEDEGFSERAMLLLRRLANSYPELAAEILAKPSTTGRERLATAIHATAAPEAEPATVPALLAEPPWSRAGAVSADTTVVEGLTPAAGTTVRWAPGERAAWRWQNFQVASSSRTGFETRAASITKSLDQGDLSGGNTAWLFANGPMDLIEPLIRDDRTKLDSWELIGHGRRLAARHGTALAEKLRRAAAEEPRNAGHTLLPFCDAATATLMAHWRARRPVLRHLADTWLARHGSEAATLLIPAALGPLGRDRLHARQALWVAAQGCESAVIEAAGEHGTAVQQSIATLLATNPLLDGAPAEEAVPEPAAAVWVDVEVLPPVLLSSGEQRLPDADVRTLLHVLQLPWLSRSSKALVEFHARCDSRSLAEFCWQLFLAKFRIDQQEGENWEKALGCPATSWVARALGWFGDDQTARDIVELLRHHKGKDLTTSLFTALADIGTDRAWSHLIRSARRGRAGREHAELLLAAHTYRQSCSTAQLADQVVPRLGFSAAGTLTVDYGVRQFACGLNDGLQVVITDGAGKTLKTLPRPVQKDEPTAAAQGYQRLRELRDDLSRIAEELAQRLERELVQPTDRNSAQFRAQLGHPILCPMWRGLVWLAIDAEGTQRAFRVAEDGTFADVEDDEFHLDDHSTVTLAHPAQLGDDLRRWTELFGEYKVIQPIVQLGRPVHRLEPEERGAVELARYQGKNIGHGRFKDLTIRGWEWAEGRVGKPFARRMGAVMAVLEFEHWDGAWSGDLVIAKVRITRPAGSEFRDDHGLPLSELGLAGESELLNDLHDLFA